VLATVLCAGVVFAQGPAPDLKVTVSVEREVTRVGPDGREVVTREQVDIVRPGDVLVYTVRAENQGAGPAIGARIKDPIPEGTVLIVDSVETEAGVPSASLDGGKTWQAFPATVTRRGENGRDEEVPAPPAAYTDLRWQLLDPMNPGQAKSFEFKVRVL
jgi:uncharacterized repeat protein (TIGR01451 family)